MFSQNDLAQNPLSLIPTRYWSACSSLDFLQISRAIGVPSIFNTFLFPISGSVNDSRLKAVGVWFQHIDPWNICLREKKKKKKHCWELYSWRGLLKGAICKVTDCWVSFPGHHMLMFWVGDQPELLALSDNLATRPKNTNLKVSSYERKPTSHIIKITDRWSQ